MIPHVRLSVICLVGLSVIISSFTSHDPIRAYWKCNYPMSPSVRPSSGRLGWLLDLSLIISSKSSRVPSNSEHFFSLYGWRNCHIACITNIRYKASVHGGRSSYLFTWAQAYSFMFKCTCFMYNLYTYTYNLL